MLNAERTIVITALICAGFMGTCSDALGVEGQKPTVRELLDIYREKMDRMKSYIYETETVYTGKVIMLPGGRRIRNEGIAPRTEEIRTDGERFYIHEGDPTGLGDSKEVAIPNASRSRVWLWDGEYYYLGGQSAEQYVRKFAQKHISEQMREQYIKRAMGNVTIWVDVEEPDTARMIAKRRPNLPDYSRAYYLLNHARKVRVSDRTETINGSKCYVVEMEMGQLESKLWIDPAHGYLIAQRIDRSRYGKYYEIVDVAFKRFDGIWFVAQKDYQYFDSGGRWSEDRSRYRLTRFVLNPDHDGLKSFEKNIAEGADVRLFGADGISQRQHFTWQGGKVVDAEGNQINLGGVRPLPGLIGKPLPQLGEIGLSGRKGQTDNRPILVCFWDMEQRSSRNCVLALRDRSAELARRGIFVVVVHAGTVEQGTLEAWIKKSGVSFASTQTASDAAKTRRNWRVKALPWLILTDSKHVVVAEGFGANELADKINSIDNKN